MNALLSLHLYEPQDVVSPPEKKTKTAPCEGHPLKQLVPDISDGVSPPSRPVYFP